MNRIITISMTAIAAALLAVGCDDPNEGELYVQATDDLTEMSITTILENSSETYSLWLEMLHYTDYYNGLKDANADATVFCPNNDAMQRFLDERGVETVEDIDREYARNVVQNHIIDWLNQSGSSTSSSILTDARLLEIAAAGGTIDEGRTLFNQQRLTLSYGYMETDVDDAERTDIVYSSDSVFINNHAKLGRFVSTKAKNGVIYMMDGVIIPNAENIAEKLESLSGDNNTFQIFAEAVKSDPEVFRIASLERDTTVLVGGSTTVTEYYYTVFATPDYIYNKEGITSVESLKQWLVNNSDGEEVNPDTALNHYLKYHFMTTRYTMDEVFNFTDSTETLIYDTQYSGQAFIANIIDDKRVINKEVNILRSDVEASNGYITKVDGVMPVYHPEQVTVRWDFLNSADIISAVNLWGAANFYGDVYSSALASTERTFDLSDEYYDGAYGTLTSFTYELAATSASTRNYRRIGFIKEAYASVTQTTTPKHGAYLNNYLMLNLGFGGWVEFTTPTIIAGRYKVVLHYIKDPMLASLFSSGTLVQFNIDADEEDTYQSSAYLYRGQSVTPLYTSLEETLWNTVEFDGSQIHKFKITFRDVSARTESYYHLRLDYVEFIPID